MSKMKFGTLGGTISYVITRFSPRNGLGSWFYSTLPPPKYSEPWIEPMMTLSRRIFQVNSPKISVIPILDQWIQQVQSVHEDQLLVLIKNLRTNRRFIHALEISTWMTDKRYFVLTPRDIAIRLDLIAKVHGIEQAENYFNDIPEGLKVLQVYGSLLNCYAYVKSVEKAEAVMQTIRDLGCPLAHLSLAYNCMLNLYCQTGNTEKLGSLMQEMDEKGIGCEPHDKHTYEIRLRACAAVSNIEEMERTLARMESDSKVALDWATYAAVAGGYTNAGLLDKALEMLKKSEELITQGRTAAYNFLITQYAATGKKEEVLRIWEVYQKKGKVFNRGYISTMTSLLKLDDLESAENIFQEWESQNLYYDIFIPNLLFDAYSKDGLMEKAEALLDRVMSRGGKPNAKTWYYMARGYLQNDQTMKAVKSMKEVVVVSGQSWKPVNESLVACLDHLKGEGDLEKTEDFLKLLRDNDLISLDIEESLLNHVSDRNSNLDARSTLSGNSLIGSSDSVGLSSPKEDSSRCESSTEKMLARHLKIL